MGVTDQFLTYTITTLFPTSPRVWYMGLINNSPSPILGSGDTAAQIGGTNGVVGNPVQQRVRRIFPGDEDPLDPRCPFGECDHQCGCDCILDDGIFLCLWSFLE